MILLSLLLILGSVVLLAAGFLSANLPLVIGSILASVLAGGALYGAARQRRGDGVEPEGTAGELGARRGGRAQSGQQAPGEAPPANPPPPWSPPAGAAPPGTPPQWSPPAGSPPPGSVERVPAPPVDEPGEEQVGARDAARVAALRDEVLVVDGRPRYHRASCPHLAARQTVPVPVSEARAAGFTPCALCRPDAALLSAQGGLGGPI